MFTEKKVHLQQLTKTDDSYQLADNKYGKKKMIMTVRQQINAGE